MKVLNIFIWIYLTLHDNTIKHQKCVSQTYSLCQQCVGLAYLNDPMDFLN